MAITYDELLAGAKDLLDGASDEFGWRTATSRAYYAAFHRCIAVAQEELPGGVSPRIGHRELGDTLKSANRIELTSIAYRLEQCRMRRIEADYVLEADFEENTARTVIAQCRRIYGTADAL